MTRIITIASGKGGVGKTTVASNLGVVLQKHFDQNTLIIDANFTTAHLGFFFDLIYFPYSLNDILTGKKEFERSVYLHPFSGVSVLPASTDLQDILKTNLKKFEKVIEKAKKKYDIILIDSAPGFGKEAMTALLACKEVLIVTTPEISSLEDAKRLVHVAKQLKKKILGIVINRSKKTLYQLSKKEIEEYVGIKSLVEIPELDIFQKSLFLRIPAVLLEEPYVTETFKFLAAKILNLPYSPKYYKSFGELLKQKFKSFRQDLLLFFKRFR